MSYTDIESYRKTVSLGLAQDNPYSWSLWEKAYNFGKDYNINLVFDLHNKIDYLENLNKSISKYNQELQDKIAVLEYEKLIKGLNFNGIK